MLSDFFAMFIYKVLALDNIASHFVDIAESILYRFLILLNTQFESFQFFFTHLGLFQHFLQLEKVNFILYSQFNVCINNVFFRFEKLVYFNFKRVQVNLELVFSHKIMKKNRNLIYF